MSLTNCFSKLNAGKPVFSEAEMKEIRALANRSMGKMSTADAEKAAVQSMLDQAYADQKMVAELIREATGMPEPKPSQQGQAEFDLHKDGIIGKEIAWNSIPNGSDAFQYALGRTEDGGSVAIFRRRADERGTYGGWRWEADENKLKSTQAATDNKATQPVEEEKTRRSAEKETFVALAGLQNITDAAINTPLTFRAEAETQVAKWLAAEIKSAAEANDTTRAKALSGLLADGKPTLPDSFYDGLLKEVQQNIKQKKLADLVAASKEALTVASASSEDRMAFVQGWDHALSGKTKSTLSGKVQIDGYESARKWLDTPEGKAAYTGKRAKKLENTGADLRRWFDEQKAKITEGDTDVILANIENATTRAELFRNVLTPESTPGAQRWLEGVRNKILPFKRWITEKGALRYFDTYVNKRTSDTDKIRQYLDGKLSLLRKKDEPAQSREDRIKTMRDAADEYATLVALLTDKLDGSNVESLAKSLESAVFKSDIPSDTSYYRLNEYYSDEGKQIAGLMTDEWRLLRNYGWSGNRYLLNDLIKNENNTVESTRKAALTPPRLDRVDRDGEDYRKGKNVTPQEFKRTFNFADVGFGKWVGAKQDQDHLNYSFDAFRDLAGLLNLPAEAISLGGRLHFTIGALGHGKFAAHYMAAQPHPDGGTVPVINVTNTRGDGTVAHEWSHALDLTPQENGGSELAPLKNAIAEIKKDLQYAYNFDRMRASVVSMLKGTSYWTNNKRAKNTEDGRLDNAKQAINYYAMPSKQQSNYYVEAQKLDGGKKDPYWSSDKELFARAFEAWVGDAMDTSNTYLVNPSWSGDAAVTGKTHRGTPYPTGEERERFNQWFDALAKSLVYDPELKVVRLDTQKWAENKPKIADEWKQAQADLRAELPSMLEGLKREQSMVAQQQADEKAHGDSIQVGDRVRAREGRETQFSSVFGDVGAVVTEVRDSSYGRTLYFEGANNGMYARNAEVVQRKADIEALAKAETADAVEQKVEAVGELSEADLSRLFDEAAAELQESTQEKPEAPVPGESVHELSKVALPEGWSQVANDGLATSRDPKSGGIIDKTIKTGEWFVIPNDDSIGKMEGFNTRAEAFAALYGAIAKKNKEAGAALFSGRDGKLPDSKSLDKTAANLAAEAAKLGVTGINEALTGLAKLFGAGPGKLQSFPGNLNRETYEQAKPHFEAALKSFQKAGKTIKELFKFLIENFGAGVKPYAIHFAKEMNLTAGLGQQPTATRTVAEYVKAKLDTGINVSWQDLFNRADAAYGGTQAEGKYTVKDAYDAMELGVNLYLRDKGLKSDTNTEAATSVINRLTALIDKLPTQTKRTAEMDEFQQFSTPPALAYAASWVANIKPTDTLLEPSAGTGDLAIYADNMGAKLILNELSSRRAEILRELYPNARIFTENAEQLNNVLPDDAIPTVVVMNPPFSSTAGRVQGQRSADNGAKHVEQALKRLPKNGRLVAITGSLPSAWVSKIKQSYNIRAMVDISGKEYAKYGTTFDNQIIVIDNDGKTAHPIVAGRVESVSELPKLLEGVRNDKPLVSQSAAAQHESGQTSQANRLDAGSENATGNGAVDAVGVGSEPSGARAGLGDGAEFQQPSKLGGTDNQPGKNQSQTANAVPDGNGKSGQVPDRLGRNGTGRGSSDAAGRANLGGAGAAGETSGLTVSQTETQKHKGELTASIFESYTPQRLSIPGAKAHPGQLVQSAAMAAVEPPTPTYIPNLPKEVIDKGLLSLAQLESVVYAGQAHQQFLPNGERRGWFIGDGTGVGKGREISGIILDNLRQGRQKAVWVSYNEGLINDAQRDFSGVGGDPKAIFWQGKTKPANPITAKHGILFTAYSTLKGGEKKQANDQGQKQGRTRLDQIIDWVGKDFDGVIVFDEAHSMGNIIEMKGKRGKKKPAQQAIAGANLQKLLPKARIVYVSATGATEVSNLGYASRLGLWGEGSAFADVKAFISNIAEGGVASMELISRDMKALGMYIARSLSFDGVTYQRLEHELTPLQNDIYNELAKAWQGVLQNIDDALKQTDGAKNGNAKSAAMSAFWGAHQRFFNQVITSLQTPTVIEDMQKQIADGNAVVIQLVNTNEATQEREAAKAAAEGKDLEELDFTPRQMLMDYVRNSFPVQAYEETQDAEGNTVYTPAVDSNGNPVFDKEAIAMRDKLLETLEHIRVPENPIDAIVAAFGSDKVGEVTGRKRRFIQQRDEDGNLKVVEEKRGKHAAHNDATDFQNDKKPILIFSQAGGTGFSFHADNTAKNQRKRVHYILQPGWRADAAVQGFGRTHRTNQKQAPHYVLPTTNLKAQKRFVSSIARRLDQLGALTKGERQASSQGLFTASDNLESKYAADALDVFFQDMYRGATPLNFNEISKAMGLDNLVDPKTGGLNVTKLPEIPQFLNRLLSLESHQQDEVFAEFEKRLDEVVNFAVQNGTYDNGMQTLKAESIKKVRDDVAYTDERTGAQTRYVEIDVTNPVKYLSWDKAQAWAENHKDKFAGWYKNTKGEVFGMADMGERVNSKGETVNRGALIGIRDGRVKYVDNVKEIRQGYKYGYDATGRNYGKQTITTELADTEAQKAWEEHIKAAPKTETTREHMIVGVILPIWDRVKGHPRIVRLQTDDGERMIGRVMGPKDAKETLKNLGLGSTASKMTPGKALEQIRDGARAVLANGWEISQATVSGDKRIEISKASGYFSSSEQALLTEQGAFFERIQWQERAFIPSGENGLAVFERITKSKPVVNLIGAKGMKETGEQGSALFSIRAPISDNRDEQIRLLQDKLDTDRTDAEARYESGDRVDPDTGDFYGGGGAGYSQRQAQVRNPHTLSTLKTALNSAFSHVKDFAGLLEATGKVHFIGRDEIEGYLGDGARFSKAQDQTDIRYSNGGRILAFVKDGQTYFVHDNISQSDDNIKGLAMHEIALHALQLGRADVEFQSILKQIETMRKIGNKQVVDAFNRVPKDTPAHLVTEEGAGYLIEGHPDLSIVQKLIARFRALLRMVGNKLPMTQRMQWFKWANTLTVEDVVLMAQDTMKTAPETLVKAEARGTFKADQQDRFYSQLRRVMRDAPDKIFNTGDQVKLWLQANAGKNEIKKDEIYWSGINDFLDMQKGKVSKADVLAYLDNNGVQVKEVMLGDVNEGDVSVWWNDEGGANEEVPFSELNPIEEQDAISRYRDEVLQYAEEGAPKFTSYQLPGGENYKELLLTLPSKKPIEYSVTKAKSGDWLVVDNEGDNVHGNYGDSEMTARAAASQMNRESYKAGVTKTDFRSSHFDQSNILSHIRFNERWSSADGTPYTPPEKVLFIEEMQSDWGQKGKREGFGAIQGWMLRDKNTNMIFADYTDKAKAEAAARRHGNAEMLPSPDNRVGIPNAPFVTDTKAWTALSLKRMIAYAIEHGFDKIAWTNGEQQAARYDLSKQIDMIRIRRLSDRADSSWFVEAYRGGDKVIDRSADNLSALSELIGKDMADRASKEMPNKGSKEYSGLDLKVGGTGMKGYYDQIVPQVANEILRKMGGGKVESVKINAGVNTDDIEIRWTEDADGIQHIEWDGNERKFKTEAEAKAFREKLKTAKSEQPGFTITPELRAKVMNEGMPLFSKSAAQTSAKNQNQYGELTPEQSRAISEVVGRPKTLIERAKEFSKDWQKNMVQGIVDQYAPIKEYSMSAYIKARMSKGSASTLEAVFLYGKPYIDANGDITGDYSNKNGGMNGFASVLAPLDGEHDRFVLWVAALRADRLKSIGLENLWSGRSIAELKKLNLGKLQNGKDRAAAYATALKGLNEYNDAMLKIASERGLINDVTRKMYQDMPYIPFYRLSDEDVVQGFTAQSGMVNQTAWKKLKGGTQKLNEDLLANLLQNWSHLIEASARNDAAKATLEAAVKVGAATEVPNGYPGKGTVSFRDNVVRTIPVGKEYIEDGVTKVSDGTAKIEENTERTFMVSDPHLMDAITSISNTMRAPKVMRQFKHMLTTAVTANPAFKLRNLIRDSVQSMALADLSLNPAKNIKEGAKLTHINSETRAKMLFGGGMIRFGSMLDGNNANMARELVNKGVPHDHILDNDGKIKGLWDHYIKPAFDAYQELGDRGEQINRAALFDILTKPVSEGGKGMTQGEANFWARDLMDFSMSGKWQAIRFLTQTVPFMNARLQGLYKLGKAAKADKARFGIVVGGVAMASLMLLAAYGDDDDWKKREDWDRDNYWWFKIGGHAFRIPKPFEIGAIGTLAERSAELMFDKEMTGRRFRERLGNIVSQQLSMNPTPQLVKPLIDLWANKDSFSGRPIETMGMDKLKPEDRIGAHTTGVAKVLGMLGMPNPAQLMMGNYEQLSPVQIDFLIKGYFSWLGMAATTTLEYGIFKPLSTKGEAPAMPLRDVFFVGNFAETLPSGSSRYVSQMYEQAREIEESYNSYHEALKQGDRARAADILSADKDKIAQYHVVEAVKRTESIINNQIKRITSNASLSAEAKSQRIDQLNQQKDRLARRLKAA